MADPLIDALRSGKLAGVKAEIKKAPEKALARATVEAGRLAFQAALELLLKRGADVNAIWGGYRPLHALLQEDLKKTGGTPSTERLACLEWLLEHGADPEQPGGRPPARAILIAAFTGQPEYVKRLRKAGGKMDGFAAAALGDRKRVEKALKQRPDFAKLRDNGGVTALQCAAGSRLKKPELLEIAQILLDAGADPNALTESWGRTMDAAFFAAWSKNKPVFELLLERGADATAALVSAVWSAPPEYAELALAHGAVPDRATAENKPLLNNLICWGQIKPMLWLLEHGASPNVADEKGWTAVHQAASRGNVEIMKAVLGAGGDLKRRDAEGRLPVAIAEEAGKGKVLGIMR